MSKKLLKFLSDLAESRGQQQAFTKDPEGVMAKYGLSEAAKEAVRSKDPEKVGAALGKGLKRAPGPISGKWA